LALAHILVFVTIFFVYSYYYSYCYGDRKILELEEELKVVGNAMKSLEIFEQEVRGVAELSIRLSAK